MREFHYRWEFDLESSPEQLCPLVADTNRFNRDTGVPSVRMVESEGKGLKNARRRLRLSAFGIPVEWEEQPFEWIRPVPFGVVRRYSKGPIAELRVVVDLNPRTHPNDLPVGAHQPVGTKLTYQVWAKPRNVIGLMAIPIQIGILSARSFARTLREYDHLAKQGRTAANLTTRAEFVTGGRARLVALREKRAAAGTESELVALLVDYLEIADEFALSRIRPYELAREWNCPRRTALEVCLCATRAGILDLQWNLICPLCRGGAGTDSLRDLESTVHCPGCNIDFAINFEQSVELTFRPNPSIRNTDVETFCTGGPHVAPHVVAQQPLQPHSTRPIELSLDAGPYRLPTVSVPGWQHLRADGIGDATAFGAVMTHFDILKQVLGEEDGALVKTIGDAVMAVFRCPARAVRAMLDVQAQLASPPEGMRPLSLKAGLHTGPCIAVTLNDRLDYFGSTVNLAARLEAQSTGDDVVISSAVYSDPQVRELLGDPQAGFSAMRFALPVKGFDDEQFEVWRGARLRSGLV